MHFILPLSLRTVLISAGNQLIIWLNGQQWACDTNQKMPEVEMEAKQYYALFLNDLWILSLNLQLHFTSDINVHYWHLLSTDYSSKYIPIINHCVLHDPWPYNLAHCFPSQPTPGHCFHTTAQHLHPIKHCLASFAPQLPPADWESDSDRAQRGFMTKPAWLEFWSRTSKSKGDWWQK